MLHNKIDTNVKKFLREYYVNFTLWSFWKISAYFSENVIFTILLSNFDADNSEGFTPNHTYAYLLFAEVGMKCHNPSQTINDDFTKINPILSLQ